MIRYIDFDNTIKDRVKNLFFPKDESNEDYREYLEWVAQGNTPIPLKPSDDYILGDDGWIFDQDKADSNEINLNRANLKDKGIELFEMCLAMWNVFVDKGLVQNTDLPEDIRTKAQVWKQYLDRITELS